MERDVMTVKDLALY